MKIFKHEGRGFWIGSCVIVLANDMGDARIKIRKILDAEGLTKEELDIEQVDSDIIHVANGDY